MFSFLDHLDVAPAAARLFPRFFPEVEADSDSCAALPSEDREPFSLFDSFFMLINFKVKNLKSRQAKSLFNNPPEIKQQPGMATF